MSVKFVNDSNESFFECSAAEARAAIDFIKRQRENDEVWPKTEKELAEKCKLMTLPINDPVNGDFGYMFFKNKGGSEESYTVTMNVYTVDKHVRSVEEMIKEIKKAELENRALYGGSNIKVLEIGVISLGNTSTVRYYCSIKEFKKWFEDQNLPIIEPKELFKNVRHCSCFS